MRPFMTKAVRRMAVGIACALSFLAAASLPAQAAPTPARPEPAPPPADVPPAFVADACPPLPPDADPAQWTCGNMVFDAGYIRMGRLDQPLTEPIRLTVAYGPPDQLIFGRLDSRPMRLAGLPVGVWITPEYGGHFTPTTFTELSLRFRLTGPGLGQNCHVGTVDEPIAFTMTPVAGSLRIYPQGPNGEDIVGANYTETSFATPKAADCNGFTPTINATLDLPSPTGRNAASFRFYLLALNYTQLP